MEKVRTIAYWQIYSVSFPFLSDNQNKVKDDIKSVSGKTSTTKPAY